MFCVCKYPFKFSLVKTMEYSREIMTVEGREMM